MPIKYNNTVSTRLKPPGGTPVITQTGTSTARQGEQSGGTAAAEGTMTRPSAPSTRAHHRSPSLVRTDGNTADVSSIRLDKVKVGVIEQSRSGVEDNAFLQRTEETGNGFSIWRAAMGLPGVGSPHSIRPSRPPVRMKIGQNSTSCGCYPYEYTSSNFATQ